MLHRQYLYIITDASKDCNVLSSGSNSPTIGSATFAEYLKNQISGYFRICLTRYTQSLYQHFLQRFFPADIMSQQKNIIFQFFFSIEHLSTKWPNLELNPIVHVVSSLGSLPPVRKGQVGQWHQVHEENVCVNIFHEPPASPPDVLQSVVIGKPHGEPQQQIDTHRVQHLTGKPRKPNVTCRNEGR